MRGMGTFNCTIIYLAINTSCPISISIVGVAPAHTFVKYEASCGDRGPTLVINPMVRTYGVFTPGSGEAGGSSGIVWYGMVVSISL